MKSRLYIVLPGLFSLLFLLSCEEKIVQKYESENSVYFFRGRDYEQDISQYDSINYSFIVKENQRLRDTVYIQAIAVGFLSDRDREIELVQVKGGGAGDAVAGTHFVGLDDPEVKGRYVIPAGMTKVKLPIILLRDASLRSREIKLELELRENDFFRIVMPENSKFLIKISDMLTEPSNWNLWKSFFGEWGPVKMKFIIDYTGFTDFENYYSIDQATKNYYKMKAKEKLKEVNKEREENKLGPLSEEDDTVVVFPN